MKTFDMKEAFVSSPFAPSSHLSHPGFGSARKPAANGEGAEDSEKNARQRAPGRPEGSGDGGRPSFDEGRGISLSGGEREALGELTEHHGASSPSTTLRALVGATVEAVTVLAEANAPEVRELLEMKALLNIEEEPLPSLLRQRLEKMKGRLASEWLNLLDDDEEAYRLGQLLAASEGRNGIYATPEVDAKRGRPATFLLYSEMKDALSRAANLVGLGTQPAMRYVLHYCCNKAGIPIEGACEVVTLPKQNEEIS